MCVGELALQAKSRQGVLRRTAYYNHDSLHVLSLQIHVIIVLVCPGQGQLGGGARSTTITSLVLPTSPCQTQPHSSPLRHRSLPPPPPPPH